MIKSEHKVLIFIGRIFILILGTCFAILTILLLKTLIKDFNSAGLIGTLFYSLFSIALIYVALDSVKSIKINLADKTITVSYFGIYKRVFSQKEFDGFNLRPFSNNLGTFRGIIIELQSREQFNFSELDFRNYKSLEESLIELIPLNKNIKTNFLPPFAKAIYTFLILVILIMITFKVFGI